MASRDGLLRPRLWELRPRTWHHTERIHLSAPPKSTPVYHWIKIKSLKISMPSLHKRFCSSLTVTFYAKIGCSADTSLENQFVFLIEQKEEMIWVRGKILGGFSWSGWKKMRRCNEWEKNKKIIMIENLKYGTIEMEYDYYWRARIKNFTSGQHFI